MESVIAFRPLPSCFAPCRKPPSSIFTANRRIRIQAFASKSPKLSIPIPFSLRPLRFLEPSRTSNEEERPVLAVAQCIARQIVLALFCFAVGFAPFRDVRAVAAPVASEAVLDKDVSLKGHHEYSKYTKRLLETVAVLVKSVEEVRRGNGDVKAVEAAWKAVRAKKEELQEEIMGGLHGELRELKRDKEVLVKRSDDVFAEAVKLKRALDKLGGNAGQEKVKERMEGRLERLEEEYNGIWERVGDIEDRILRRETLALSFGVRELCFIERECEQLVQSFTRQMRRKDVERYYISIFMNLNRTEPYNEFRDMVLKVRYFIKVKLIFHFVYSCQLNIYIHNARCIRIFICSWLS